MKKITIKGGTEKNTLGGPYAPLPPNTPGLKKVPTRIGVKKTKNPSFLTSVCLVSPKWICLDNR